MEEYKGKKVLIVGLGKTGFALINIFNQFGCQIKVTDIKPIFDLNKPVKRLKKINPQPQVTLGSLPVGTEVNFLIDQYDLGINVLNGDYTNYFIEDHNLAGDISISFGRFSNKRKIYFNYLP